MKTMWKCAAASLCIAALAGCSTGALQVAEVGSFHVGGRAVTLTGLPEKELTFAPGAPPLKLDPNGDFEVSFRSGAASQPSRKNFARTSWGPVGLATGSCFRSLASAATRTW